MKEKKVTIYDIAREAGVSVGTVNRALGGKTRIRPETKQTVLDTAERLGYRANSAAQGLRRAPITLGAILFCPIDEYVDALRTYYPCIDDHTFRQELNLFILFRTMQVLGAYGFST